MPDLEIRIRPDWDTTLTYESLYKKPEEEPLKRPVFVGRDILIAPLVAEITEPDKRGTYLISGYRGTGKTTLLIEALGLAKKQLAKRNITLLPLVLNVSEVSASLGNSDSDLPVQLNIDPRRLLIALIRTIRDGIQRLPDKDKYDKLAATVDNAYQKATASKYSTSGRRSLEDVRTRSRELALALEDKNVLKTLAAVAGAAAIAFESAALIGPKLGWFHAAAVGMAAVFAVSLAASWKRGRNEKRTDTQETSVEHDNSLQQLETDLKDILASLKNSGLRTVVVLEELDKIEDKEQKGEQLASVIRYFKNLFTQAPALFFFVTDKSYFDIIASAIKRARRERSYAVEHTFFTHRIFVGRPTTEESLKFIAAIVDDEEQRQAVQAVAKTLGKPGRIDEADQLGKFVRVVLFNAANHLFDLKNELRRYARTTSPEDGEETGRVSNFLINDQTFPAEQAALAVFQDLIVEKSRSFEIKGGRAYANETLADSLYAVFNELGSNQPQNIVSFLPFKSPNPNDGLLLDEQLDLSEAARVREAVNSLIDDLERGRAFTKREGSLTFTWRDDAARAFRYVRQLQKHEEALIAELQRHVTLIDSLTPGGARHPLALYFEQRANALRIAGEPLTTDAAASEQREITDRYSSVLFEFFDACTFQLDKYGFMFEEVARGLASVLYLVKPKSGDPRLSPSSPRGGVLLAFGNSETMQSDVLSFARPTAPSLAPLDRLALVQVLHAELNQDVNWEHYWTTFLGQQSADLTGFKYAVDIVPLVERDPDSTLSVSQRIAASLAEFGTWARLVKRPYEWIPGDTPPLFDELEKWKRLDVDVFHIAGPNHSPLRGFGERDVIEVNGDVVLKLPASGDASIAANVAATCMLQGYDQAHGGPDTWEPLGKWMLKEGRIYLYVNWDEAPNWDPKGLREATQLGARLIVVKPGALPPGMEGVTFVTAPFPIEDSESPVQKT